MSAVHAVVSLKVPDDRLDRMASFEQPAFFIGQPLVLAPVFDLDVRVVLVHTPVAQVCVHHLGLDAQALHQDGAPSKWDRLLPLQLDELQTNASVGQFQRFVVVTPHFDG